MGKYSLIGSPAFEKRVDNDLATIIKILATSSVKSIVLVGGFGRGEGTVVNDEPYNDYDIVVIGKNKRPSVMHLGGFDIEISYRTLKALKSAPCTLFNYEMRHGGHVIYGDTHILDNMKKFVPQDIPLIEGTALLLNRGMLHLLNRDNKFLIKLFLAMGDSVFIAEKCHELSYLKKVELIRTKTLMPESEYLIENYIRACQFKLYGAPFSITDEDWEVALSYFHRFCLWYESQRLNTQITNLKEYKNALEQTPFCFRTFVKNCYIFKNLSMPFVDPPARMLLNLLSLMQKKPCHYSEKDLISLWRKIA